MDSTEEQIDPRIERETAALERERHGNVAITVGKVLLWVDLILVCFVEVGLRTGSRLFLWWTIVQGVLGLILLGAGMHKRSEAEKELSLMVSK